MLNFIYICTLVIQRLTQNSVYYQQQPNVYIEEKVLKLDKDNLWGVGLSGGGFRAYAVSLGQLLALSDLGLMNINHIGYLSCASGGCFTAAVFLYNRNKTGDRIFCDIAKNPALITKKWVNEPIKKECVLGFGTKDIDFTSLEIILKKWKYPTPIITNFFKKELFETYLQNFDLDINYYKNAKYNSLPFLIINGLVYDFKSLDETMPFEATPLYIGVPLKRAEVSVGKTKRYKAFAYNDHLNTFSLGGSWVSPNVGNTDIEIDYYKLKLLTNFHEPDLNTLEGVFLFLQAIYNWKEPYIRFDDLMGLPVIGKEKNKFQIQDAIGFASNIFAVASVNSKVSNLLYNDYHEHHFNRNFKTEKNKLRLGDGGLKDNLGLTALLRRKVKNIILLCNPALRIKLEGSLNFKKNTHPNVISSYLSTFFGFSDSSFIINEVLVTKDGKVFHSKDFDVLVEKIRELKRKKTSFVVELNNVEVIENKKVGIEGGWKVKRLVIFYLEKDMSWINKLKPEVKEEVEQIKKFPFFIIIGAYKFLRAKFRDKDLKFLASMGYYGVYEYFKNKSN